MRPRSADEANETSLDVVVDDGGRGPMLEQEDQVAVVEVVSLSKKDIWFLSKTELAMDTLMMTLPACRTNTALCFSSRDALFPPSLKRESKFYKNPHEAKHLCGTCGNIHCNMIDKNRNIPSM